MGSLFIDGTGITPGTENCKCDMNCEFPCWQRLGIAEACSQCGCPPLPEYDTENTEQDEA